VLQLVVIHAGGLGTDGDQIRARTQVGPLLPDYHTQPPADTIPDHGSTNTPANGVRHLRRLGLVT
jgi:hypothetical protein